MHMLPDFALMNQMDGAVVNAKQVAYLMLIKTPESQVMPYFPHVIFREFCLDTLVCDGIYNIARKPSRTKVF